MNDPLNIAEALSNCLFDQYRDPDQRCIALSRCLRVLAASIDHTDGFEPLTSAADGIEANARANMESEDIEAANDAVRLSDARRKYG